MANRDLRLAFALLVVGLLCSSVLPAGTFDSYMTASVSLKARPALNQGEQESDPSLVDVQSAGYADIRDWQGNIQWGTLISGYHFIHTSDNEWIVADRSFRLLGQYSSGQPRAQAEPGQCYRARLDASSLDLEVGRGSSEVCAADNCPLILDLDSNGFRLVGAQHGVRFDLDADGTQEALGWTSEGEMDGFLCMDRNGNQAIDDGTELFGGSTPSVGGGPAGNGFTALSAIDDTVSGGNGDGVVDSLDPGFADLCVWFDLNHDGTSQTAEIVPLQETAIVSIDYRYVETWRRDRSGNLFRFKSTASQRTRGQGTRALILYDVFFDRGSAP